MSKKSDDAASAASIEDAFCEWRGKHRKDLSCQLLFYHVQCTPDNFIHIILFIFSQPSPVRVTRELDRISLFHVSTTSICSSNSEVLRRCSEGGRKPGINNSQNSIKKGFCIAWKETPLVYTYLACSSTEFCFLTELKKPAT